MEGTVVSIDIFYTRLLTYDNKLVVIPNGILTNNSLINVTNEKHRKMEIKITIAYDSDMNKVKEVVHSLLVEDVDNVKEVAKKYNVTQNVIQRILSDNEKLKAENNTRVGLWQRKLQKS